MTNEAPATTAFIDLYWMPVGAGTHLQRASLALYEAARAAVARRPRMALVHSALKLGRQGQLFTLELMPLERGQPEAPLMTGPVGARLAGRLRLFTYQLRLREDDRLPDEQYRVQPPERVACEKAAVDRLLELGPALPVYTWGRRVPGTSEMWTSDSAVSWLLIKSGIDAASIALPPKSRAPGWRAGIEVALRAR